MVALALLAGLVHTVQLWSAPDRAFGTELDTTAASEPAGFYAVLDTGRTACPRDLPVLVLGEGEALHQIADYYFYPRRVVMVGSAEPFDAQTAAAYPGSCVAAYKSEQVERVRALGGRASEVACAPSGCLFTLR